MGSQASCSPCSQAIVGAFSPVCNGRDGVTGPARIHIQSRAPVSHTLSNSGSQGKASLVEESAVLVASAFCLKCE